MKHWMTLGLFWLLSVFVPIFGALEEYWLDLPEGKIGQLMGRPVADFPHLDKLLQAYARIPKTDKKYLAVRLEKLEEISRKLAEELGKPPPPDAVKFLEKFRTLTEHKLLYLKQLDEIWKENLDSPEALKSYHENLAELENKNWKPLILNNRRQYDVSIGQWFGEYWMETIDPCHRALTNYHDLWLQTRPKSQRLVDFFFWLEGMNVPKQMARWEDWHEENLKKCEVFVDENGRLVDGENRLLNLNNPEEEYIFIVDLGERFFVAKASSLVHHVTLSHGKPVLASGNMRIEEGRIRHISLDSGHYLPPEENGQQMIKLLMNKGIAIESDTSFYFFRGCGFPVHTTLGAAFPDYFISEILNN